MVHKMENEKTKEKSGKKLEKILKHRKLVYMSNSPTLRVVGFLILFVTLIVMTKPIHNDSDAILIVIWLILSIFYCVYSFMIARANKNNPKISNTHLAKKHYKVNDFSMVFPIIASLIGLYVAFFHHEVEPADGMNFFTMIYAYMIHYKVLTVIVCIIEWFVMNISYAHIYEKLDIESGYKAFTFNETPIPSGLEYLYLGVTIGSTFATSDVNINTSKARWVVMTHSIISFVYNTVVIAVVLDFVSGM